ncbi:hypothetical protein [Bradyrhizobium japonicum]|uniref:hypothetical protein n=1 Tax=Bradyrhizobium japonicum TaxID=375 RepID=UPI001BAE1678|nr:hypothetical protein [Bradyrhizobium japonicum]MBR0962200.1 hypothetical protein [Bradyrhizobium japonicum]
MILQEHPAYCDGFFDAIDGEPLFNDASPEYAAGWRAWWEVRNILNGPDFLDRPTEVAKLPADPRWPNQSFH